MQLIEERLRGLMLPSLAGDAAAYRMFLDELTARLRSYCEGGSEACRMRSRICCRNMRSLAPTRLRWAGAASGFTAGSIGALVYTLDCPELAAPLLGIWYLLGMLIPTAVGTWLGPWLLRW